MEGLISALGTAFAGVASNCMEIITSVAPIALGVVGALIVVKFGIRAFKSLIGR